MCITGDDGRQPAGASVTFACDPFYQLNGSATITCQCDGEWNSGAPTCSAGNTIGYYLNISQLLLFFISNCIFKLYLQYCPY